MHFTYITQTSLQATISTIATTESKVTTPTIRYSLITQTSLQATGYQLRDDEVTNFSATPLPRCHPDGEIASEYQPHTPPLLLDDKATLLACGPG